MHVTQKLVPSIEKYHPLDVAGDAIWMPIPHGCSQVFEFGYDVENALTQWGVTPVKRTSGVQILHPDDESVGKFLLPSGWSARHCHGPEWMVCDENNCERLRIRYEPDDADYIVMSWLSIPFDVQTRTSRGEVPPKEWWLELYHHGDVVFKSDVIYPFTEDVLKAREEMSKVEFTTQVFLPRMHELEAPLQEAAKKVLAEKYPLFPTEPLAYW